MFCIGMEISFLIKSHISSVKSASTFDFISFQSVLKFDNLKELSYLKTQIINYNYPNLSLYFITLRYNNSNNKGIVYIQDLDF